MEQVRFTSHRGFSVRSIIIFVLTVITAALLLVTFAPSTAKAATTATWNGGNILFNNSAYGKAAPEINAKIGVDEKATVYSYIPQTTPGPNAGSSDAFFIYFAPGVDPPTATSADFVKFTIKGSTYVDARDRQSITMTPQGEADTVGSSCSVSGIGWIICPVSVFLAESMDFLFGLIANFLVVKPLTLDVSASNGLYTAWNVMRTVANVAFVIAFLVIIYSQLTSTGMNNYGIKKLIPRLVVAAILVNVSFYISALAIDISNVIGYSINDIFNGIRKDVFNMTDDAAGAWGNAWTNLATIILGGGGILFGVGYAVVTGAVFALVPMLLILAITLFVVLVVLAARQAIIILLVIIAPLAFIANLLPNTEGLYSKWQKLFMTMLVFFPAFALIFSGAQLAGQVIIQNANGNIITVLFGMAVQIAPLAITPIMFKLGGNLLSRIAQIVNDPNKGPVDRVRKWSDRKAALKRSETLARTPQTRLGKSFLNPANAARAFSDSEKNDADRTSANNTASDNRRRSGGRYADIYNYTHDVETQKKIVEATLEKATLKHVELDTSKLAKEMTVRVLADEVSDVKGRLDTKYDEIKAGTGKYGSLHGAEFANLELRARDATRNVALNGMAQQSAKRVQSDNLYKELKDNTLTLDGQTLRDYAGGIQGHVGAQRAFAQAISEQHKAHSEMVANANAILDDYNFDAAANLSIAKNITIPGVNLDITADIQEAAIKRVASNGVIPHIEDLLMSIDLSPNGNEDYRNALVDSLKTNGSRPKFIGYGTLDQLTQGVPGGVTQDTLDNWIEQMLVAGKLSAKELATQDKDTLVRVQEAIPRLHMKTGRTAEEQTLYFKGIANLKDEIAAVRKDEDLWNSTAERKPIIDDIERSL